METLADLFRPYKQVEIAKTIGVSKTAVHFWVSGEWMPATEKLTALAEFLKIDIERLVNACSASAKARKAKVARAS